MRFLLLNQFYPPDLAPTGPVLHDVARTLVSRGHEVHVVSSRRPYEGGQVMRREERLDGVRVHRVAATGFGRLGFAGKLADYATFTLSAALRPLDLPLPDLVLSLTSPPYLGLLGSILGRHWGRPRAHWIMDLYPDVLAAHGLIRDGGAIQRSLAALARAQLGGSSLVISLGSFMARRVERYLASPTRHAAVPLWPPDGLRPWEEGRPNPIRQERGWAPEDFVAMYSGNMGLGHRFNEFLAAAARSGPAGPRWAFVGGGKRRAEIERFKASTPAARIELHPYAPGERLCDNLCAADLHLASLEPAWQGLMVPSKIQGILAVGRPVLFVGGRDNEISSWIHEAGAGWVVAPGDVDGVLRAIDEARDPAERKRRGSAAAAFAKERFDRSANSGRIADLLERAAI